MVFWRIILCPVNILLLWRASAVSAQTLQGCYKDDGSLKLANTYIYQSSGYCLKKCTELNSPVMGTESGSSCYCGNTIPAEKVDNSFCSTSCTGYPPESCGGNGYLSVYLTGTGGTYTTATSSTKNSSSVGTADNPVVSSAVVEGDHTIIIVATPGVPKPVASSSSSTQTLTPNAPATQPQKSSSLSPAAAAGTAIGLILVLVGIGALIFFIRRRNLKEDYIRQDRTPSGSSMMALSRPSPSASGKDSSVDQRLEPVMMQRRVSEGSLADEQDYSRKILRVTNPDSF